MNAKQNLEHGSQYPFDAPYSWWEDGLEEHLPMSGDWAVIAARGVIADLQDRRDIKQTLSIHRIDDDVRAEIIQTLAAIIREALKGSDK